MPLTRRRLDEEDGWVLPAALGLLVAMIALGLALLTVVDSESQAAGQQPRRDAALNLAETALSGSAFALSRSWPTYRDLNVPWTSAATCASQALAGTGSGVAPTGTSAFATNVQQVVDQAWGDRPDAPTARWSLHVCDDTGAGNARSTLWSDGGLGNPAYDSNGPEQVAAAPAASPPQPAYRRRRMWVRAQATVSGRSRAVAGLVQVVEQPALPAGYATIAGKVSYLSSSTPSAINDLLTSTGSAAGQLTSGLTGNGTTTGVVRGGYTGVRCGVLDLCLDSTVSTVTDVPLVKDLTDPVVSTQVKQFGAPTAASADALDRLRQQAVQTGRYVTSTPGGGSCFANASTPTAGSVTFIEQVGGGDDACTITATGGNAVGTVVVGSGRVDVQGAGRVDAVLYARNAQDDRTKPIVHITRGVTVNGGVYVDGGGMLALDSPAFSSSALTAALCQSGGLLLCTVTSTLNLLGANELVDLLLNGGDVTVGTVPLTGLPIKVHLPPIGAGTLVTALLQQLTNDPPAITLDTTQTNGVVTYGTAGTVQRSFREVPPRAAG